MNRHRNLVVESLEGKLLLSGMAATAPDLTTQAVVSHPHAHHGKATPAIVKTTQNGLDVSVTTNERAYRLGDKVEMTLTATNPTTNTINATTGPSVNGFTVTNGAGKVVWSSNSGIQPMWVMLHSVAPGKSFNLDATWTPTAAGTYTIHNSFAPAASETIRVR